jgi:hypothetical protein
MDCFDAVLFAIENIVPLLGDAQAILMSNTQCCSSHLYVSSCLWRSVPHESCRYCSVPRHQSHFPMSSSNTPPHFDQRSRQCVSHATILGPAEHGKRLKAGKFHVPLHYSQVDSHFKLTIMSYLSRIPFSATSVNVNALRLVDSHFKLTIMSYLSCMPFSVTSVNVNALRLVSGARIWFQVFIYRHTCQQLPLPTLDGHHIKLVHNYSTW